MFGIQGFPINERLASAEGAKKLGQFQSPEGVSSESSRSRKRLRKNRPERVTNHWRKSRFAWHRRL
jgi:hypothetical protein